LDFFNLRQFLAGAEAGLKPPDPDARTPGGRGRLEMRRKDEPANHFLLTHALFPAYDSLESFTPERPGKQAQGDIGQRGRNE